MNRADLIELLTSAGVSPTEAEARADEQLTDYTQRETLAKSLDALSEIADRQAEAEREQAAMIAHAQSEGETALAELIAPALDAMLSETRAQNEALCKGLTGALELLKGLKSEMKALKSRPTAQPAAQPMAKSLDYIPAPHEATPAQDARDELFKALTSNTNSDRASEMLHAAALLESGANPADIKARFGL
jgi:hypothetical protein